MSYRYEKSTGDIVIEGFENGISPSPHKGLANLQNVNISTETGEVMCSFNRVKQTQTGTSGTLTQVNTNTVSISGITLLVGQVITITNAGTTGLSGNYYYISTGKLYAGNNVPSNPATATVVTGITAGSATFTIAFPMGTPYQSATERYTDASGNIQYRYYILDLLGSLWCHDTATLSGIDTPIWFNVYNPGPYTSGLAVLNGWLFFFNDYPGTNNDYWMSTSRLGTVAGTSGNLGLISQGVHYSFVGHQGKMYVTDGNYIASYFPNTSLITGNSNIQSYCEYTGGAGTGSSTITDVIGGSYPNYGAQSVARVPVVFFSQGTLPSAITAGQVYWIQTLQTSTPIYFTVWDAQTAGNQMNMAIGAVGRQFFNTFYPISTGGRTMLTFTPQRLNLPYFETAQCMAELGNTLVIGCSGNVLYPWDQISPLPADLIPLPENDTHGMITVNNMLYVFAGHKGNVYLTNGSSASLATSVPDYCAGIAGTPASYIEPYFSWGGAMYCRGRVYFSVLDQTATKAGNCGGVWSFVPTQNFYIGQDTGLALRLENQNSYGTYNGYAPVLINSMVQTAIAPQYWSGWVSDINIPNINYNGIDTAISYANAGIIGNCATFDGTTSNIALSNPIAIPTNLTVSAWIKKVNNAGYQVIFADAANISGLYPYWYLMQNGQKLEFAWASTNTDYIGYDTTSNVITDTNWHFVVVTQTGTSAPIFYVDNVVAPCSVAFSAGSNIKPPVASGSAFGRTGLYPGYFFNGSIDESGIWSRALSSTEVSQLYNSGAGFAFTSFTSSLLSSLITYYNFNSYSNNSYTSVCGIDFTDTVPCTTAIIETDLIPTGTVINKKTFQQLEYKLASPLANGESISLNYRLNGVDAWASVGTLNVESTTALAGYFDVNFQNTQWTQLQVILNSLGNSSSSFVRLNQVRMR